MYYLWFCTKSNFLFVLFHAGNIIGGDVVELNPDRDPSGITAAVAAKIAKEIAGQATRKLN